MGDGQMRRPGPLPAPDTAVSVVWDDLRSAKVVENVDLAVLKTAMEWIRTDGEVVLVTVAKTWGSSPRPAGSMMIWRRDGQFEGSLSGGCIEEELFEQFAEASPSRPASITYGVTKEQAVRRGLPCGGGGGGVRHLERLASRVGLDAGV